MRMNKIVTVLSDSIGGGAFSQRVLFGTAGEWVDRKSVV